MTAMPDTDPNTNPTLRPVVGPPGKHQLTLMIWLAVFPTLTVLNLAPGDWRRTLPLTRTGHRATFVRRTAFFADGEQAMTTYRDL